MALFAGFPQVASPDEPVAAADDGKWDVVQRLATDRKVIVTLQSLHRLLRAGDDAGASDEFLRLRTADPFSLVPSRAEPGIYVPLYQALFAAAFELPEAVRESVIRTAGAAAEKSLSSAVAIGSAASLPRLICEYAGTAASIKAHFVLARLHLNRGNTLAAKSWLQPMLHKRMTAAYRVEAIQILDSLDNGGVQLESVTEQLPAQAPQHLVWQSRLAASTKLRRQIDVFQTAAARAKVVPQNAWKAVCDGQTAYRRTLRGLASVDLATGSTRWEYPMGLALDAVISSGRTNSSVFGEPSGEQLTSASFARMEQSPLANTFCRDNLLGRLEGDSNSIYAVVTDGKYQTSSLLGRGFRVPASSGFVGNKLVAIRKDSGSRIWSLGQATIEEHLGTTSSDCWIAGPPETAGHEIFCVFEWNNEIRLGSVSASTGELRWTTALAYPEQSIEKDVVRRLWGAKPTRAGGLIWCLTTAGWLVCVDELSHSVIHATAIQTESNNKNAVSVGRGQPVVFTRPSSLSDRWSVSRLIVLGDMLVAMAHESHDIVMVDINSGRLIRRIAVEPGAVVAHADAQNIVVGTISRLSCIETKSGEIVWTHELTSAEGTVTGQGVRRGSQLLAPMSTGAIAMIDLDSGDFVTSVDTVLPKHGWGGLIAPEDLQGDIVYVAPDRMTRLSSRRPDIMPEDPVEVASGLMAAGKWLAALELAASVDETDAARREAESIVFQCRLQLAEADPERYLQELLKSPMNSDQKVKVQVCEASVSLSEKRFETAAVQLVKILGLSSSVLSMPVPHVFNNTRDLSDDELSKSELKAGSQTSASLPLVTWCASRLDDCLDEVALTAELSEGIGHLPDLVLLSIHHPALRPILHQRIREADSIEAAWHLLRHSLDLQLKARADGLSDVQPETPLLATQFQKVLSASSTYAASNKALRRLLAAISTELPEAVIASMPSRSFGLGDMSAFESVNDDLRENQEKQFADWKKQPYRAVPITRLSSSNRNSGMFAAAELDDPFMRHYRWSAVHGDYGRILAESVSFPNEQWSIPSNIEVTGTYSNRTDILQRVGSILVLKTYSSISAISVLDGKVLWTKPIASESGGAASITQHNSFSSFVAGRNQLPSWQAVSLCRIVGSGSRWLCVTHGLQMEVIDLFSGMTSWSADLPDSQCHVIATDDVVIVRSPSTSQVMCFDRRDGEPVSIAGADKLADSAIRNVASRLVCWSRSVGGSPHRLTWINPLTQKTEKEVSLDDMKQFHFLDDRTLIGINDNQKFLVVDLLSGSIEECCYRIDGKDSPDEPNSGSEEQNGPPDLPLWDPARLQVTADALNYYVSNRGSNHSSNSQPFGRQMTRFEGGLRAVNRATGTVRWWIYNDVSLLASTDQPELGVLVLVSDSMSNPVGGNAPVSKNVFRSIAKVSGDELFSQSIPSQYGIRYISMDSPAANILDIGVQGMKIRMEAESIRSPNQSSE